MQSCEVCNAKVNELRRGRCWGCYSQWVEARPVGAGARCVTCPEKRRRVMKTVELFGSWKPMCFNCCGQLLHLDPLPETIAAMRELVSRERRKGDRRVGRADTRVFQYERRVGDRRTPRTAEGSGPLTAVPVEIGFDDLYDDVVIEIGLEDLELVEEVRVEEAMAFEDVTRIRELVQDLRPADFPLPPATLAVR